MNTWLIRTFRVNIGNARLYGLEEDLGLSSSQFQVAVSILFVTYLLFEVPSNLVLKLFTPRRWLAFITTAWGIIATLTGLVNSYGALLACRLLLGAVEAGLFPGLTVYLTFFYTKRELALRVGYLFVSAAVAGALGGLLAYGIGHMDGLHGMSGWRWIMIIEGIPSFVIGVITYFALPNDAETAYFLDDDEKALMRLRHAREYGNTASSREFSKKDMMCAFKDWKVWAFCVAQFGVDTMLYGKFHYLTQLVRLAFLTNDCRILYLFADHHQGSRRLDSCRDAAPNCSVLLPRSCRIHDDGVPLGQIPAPRTLLCHIWTHQCCWVRGALGRCVLGRALLWLLPCGWRFVRCCGLATCLGKLRKNRLTSENVSD